MKIEQASRILALERRRGHRGCGIDGRTPLKIKTSAMMGIILPRVEEIFSVVAETCRAPRTRT